jgi:hypothetical protein
MTRAAVRPILLGVAAITILLVPAAFFWPRSQTNHSALREEEIEIHLIEMLADAHRARTPDDVRESELLEWTAEREPDQSQRGRGTVYPLDVRELYAHQRAIALRLIEFVNDGYISEELVNREFPSTDTPALLAFLLDDAYRPIWPDLVTVVTLKNEPAITVPVLIQYIKQPDRYEFHEVDKLTGKFLAVEYLGLLGGGDVELLLRQCITTDGAREVGKAWLSGPMPSPYESEYDPVNAMLIRAARGLIYTGTPENAAFVEQLHRVLLPQSVALYAKMAAMTELTNQERDTLAVFENVAEILASRDLMLRIGREAFRPLALDTLARWSQLPESDLVKYGLNRPHMEAVSHP